MEFAKKLKSEKFIVGMVHLPPLSSYSDSPGIEALKSFALSEIGILQSCGFSGALIENEYDRPHQVYATPETTADMTSICLEARRVFPNFTLGVEILLNDPQASMSVAAAANLDFIRTDYLVDRMRRADMAIDMTIDPEGLVQLRKSLNAEGIAIVADIQVKYAEMIEPRPLSQSAELAAAAGADAIIVTGAENGDPVQSLDLQAVKLVSSVPVLIGSGLDHDNYSSLLSECDGAIVGSSLMINRRLDVKKCRAMNSLRMK